MFNGFLKYLWIGLYLFMAIFPYTQVGYKGIYFSLFMISIVSILVGILYYQEKSSEKNHEEKPGKEDEKYTMGNFSYDVKRFVEMFNSAESDRDFLKAKTLLDNILEKQKSFYTYNRFFSGYMWDSRNQMRYLQEMMENYQNSKYLRLSDLTRIKTFVKTLEDTVVGFGLNSFDTGYHYKMRKQLSGLKGYQRKNKIRLLNAKYAYNKRISR